MPVFPVRDRTISLQIEAAANTPSNTASAQSTYLQQFLPNTGLLGNVFNSTPGTETEKPFSLIGPTQISINHSAQVASESGLFTNFLQPWFIKPIEITIRGGSYMGAFAGLSRADNDAQVILAKFRRTLNDFTSLAGSPGTAQRVLLNLSGMPTGLDRFRGYITSFITDENIKTVYMLDYTLQFIGLSTSQSVIKKGKSLAAQAAKSFGIG